MCVAVSSSLFSFCCDVSDRWHQCLWQLNYQWWRIWFSGLWHHLVQRQPFVSEEHIASIFQEEEWAKQKTSRSRWLLLFNPDVGGHMFLPNIGFFELHSITMLKTILFIDTIVRTAVIINYQCCSLYSNLRQWWGIFLGSCYVVLCLPWSIDHLWWSRTKLC
jgi:hypothetical protein